MTEYIEREALMRNLKHFAPEQLTPLIESLIQKQPAEDVVEVRHGTWLLEREPDGKPYCFHCSVCDSDFHHIGIKTASDFCPNCGAKMDGKDGTDYA